MNNFNHTNFIGLTKISEFKKSAVAMETEWGEKNPFASGAIDLGISAIPYVGTAAGIYDAVNSFRNGSVWGGLGNLGLAGLALIPVPGVAAGAKGTANGIKAALKAAKAGKSAKRAIRAGKIVKKINTAGVKPMSQAGAWTRTGVGLAGETGKAIGAEDIHNNREEERKRDSNAGWDVFSQAFDRYSNQNNNYSTESGYYDEFGNSVITY